MERGERQMNDVSSATLVKALHYIGDLLTDLRVSQEFADPILEAIIHLIGW